MLGCRPQRAQSNNDVHQSLPQLDGGAPGLPHRCPSRCGQSAPLALCGSSARMRRVAPAAVARCTSRAMWRRLRNRQRGEGRSNRCEGRASSPDHPVMQAPITQQFAHEATPRPLSRVHPLTHSPEPTTQHNCKQEVNHPTSGPTQCPATTGAPHPFGLVVSCEHGCHDLNRPQSQQEVQPCGTGRTS